MGVGTSESEQARWYSVRCIFHWRQKAAYEERITVWTATSHEDAVHLAEREAQEYGRDVGTSYVGVAQSYELSDDPSQLGAEVFSLIRDSELDPEAYAARFFATGTEHQAALAND